MQLGGILFKMAIFPTPTVNDTRDLELIFRWVNAEATGGIFFPIMILVVWAIAFIGAIAEGREASRAFIFANFITSVLGIILGLLGFLQPAYIYFTIILLGFGLIWAKLTKRRF